MIRTMLKSKIHRATVTGADINYEGSVTLDPVLMEAADILPYEQVQVLDINNGNRLTTYAIEGRRGSGDVIINGAAARLVSEGDVVIILTYRDVPDEAARSAPPGPRLRGRSEPHHQGCRRDCSVRAGSLRRLEDCMDTPNFDNRPQSEEESRRAHRHDDLLRLPLGPPAGGRRR